jgi:hypothetical protein
MVSSANIQIIVRAMMPPGRIARQPIIKPDVCAAFSGAGQQ